MTGEFLHCDDCHHEVDVEGGITEAHVGTRCPVCGSDMLKAEDIRRFRRLKRIMRFLAFFGLVRTEPRDEHDEVHRLRVHNGRLISERL